MSCYIIEDIFKYIISLQRSSKSFQSGILKEMEWVKVLLFLCSIHRIYGKENMSFSTSKTSDQFSGTTSLRVSNVLRDVLNQESLVRLSMVQKIQKLAMDSIDHKSKVELLLNSLKGITSEMKTLKTKNEQQEERIAALEDQNVKLNEHVHQLLQHQDGERNRSLLLKQDAIEMFEENEAFQALWYNINETSTRMKSVEDSLHNVSNAFSKTGKAVLLISSLRFNVKQGHRSIPSRHDL